MDFESLEEELFQNSKDTFIDLGIDDYRKKQFLIQCALLEKTPYLRVPKDGSYVEWVYENFWDKVDSYYPIPSSAEGLNIFTELIDDWRYGRNAFPWGSLRIPFRLKEIRVKLYFVKIRPKALGFALDDIYKVGINTKEMVIGHWTNARFSGKTAEAVSLLREIDYEDGRDAFIREQKVIMASRREINLRYDQLVANPSEKEKRRNHEEHRRLIESKHCKQLGYSEWVWSWIEDDQEAIAMFSQLVDYPPDFAALQES